MAGPDESSKRLSANISIPCWRIISGKLVDDFATLEIEAWDSDYQLLSDGVIDQIDARIKSLSFMPLSGPPMPFIAPNVRRAEWAVRR